MKRFLSIAVVIMAAAALFAGCGKTTEKYVIKTINGEPADVNNVYASIGKSDPIKAYLDDTMTYDDAVAIGRELLAVSHVADVRFVDKDEALEAYREQLGDEAFEEILQGEENPLPYAYEVIPDAEAMQDADRFNAVTEQLRKVELVRDGKVIGGVASVSSHYEVMQELSLSTIELAPDGTAALTYAALPEKRVGKWLGSDSSVTIKVDDRALDFTLDKDEMTADFGGYRYVFVRE